MVRVKDLNTVREPTGRVYCGVVSVVVMVLYWVSPFLEAHCAAINFLIEVGLRCVHVTLRLDSSNRNPLQLQPYFSPWSLQLHQAKRLMP